MLNSPVRSTPSISPSPDLPPVPPNLNIQQKPFKEKLKKPSITKLTILIITLSSLLVVAFFVWKNQYQAQQLELSGSRAEQQASLLNDSTPKPSPSPTFLRQGKNSYTISQGDKTVPQIRKAIIDPLDPKLNENQTVQIKISHPNAIESVTLKLTSDNDQTEIDMKLIEGTSTDGTWEAKWKIQDTVLYNYLLTVTAKSGNKIGLATIAMRKTL